MDGSAHPSNGPAATTVAPTAAPGARRVRRAVVIALAVAGLGGGLAACSDDETVPVVSDEDYAESVTSACDRHMTELLREWDQLRAGTFSDAELAAFYRSEQVPRMRSILRSVRNDGLPPAEPVHNGITDAASALQEIEDDAAGLIDRRRDGTFLEGENPWINLNVALAAARLDCAIEPNDWEP